MVYGCRLGKFLLFSSSKYLDRCKGSENLGVCEKVLMLYLMEFRGGGEKTINEGL